MVDTVIVQSADESKEDPQHVEAMIAKVDAAEAAARNPETDDSEAAPTKPDWVPEKFWDAEKGEIRTEALAQSYKELEAKQGGKKEETPEETPEASPEDPAAKELADKGLNIADFQEEFARDGKLSDASYEALAKAGFGRDIVDAHIAGQQALADKLTSEVHAVTGGAEGFAEMAAWAAQNADQKLLDAYNRAVDSRDLDAVKLAAAGLYQQFQQARPQEPSLIAGAGGKVSSEVYESIKQLQDDMGSEAYKTDPAFRRKVQEKLGRSNIL